MAATRGAFWKVVMTRFPCPYLKGDVALTAEREEHIPGAPPRLAPEASGLHQGDVGWPRSGADERTFGKRSPLFALV